MKQRKQAGWLLQLLYLCLHVPIHLSSNFWELGEVACFSNANPPYLRKLIYMRHETIRAEFHTGSEKLKEEKTEKNGPRQPTLSCLIWPSFPYQLTWHCVTAQSLLLFWTLELILPVAFAEAPEV